MIRIRRGTVVEVRPAGNGLTDLVVEVDGERAQAIAYDALTGPVGTGERVVLNTTAVALGLGTGGAHIVMAVEGRDDTGPATGHAMKLRYTPVQSAVDAVEQTHAEEIDSVTSLEGMPVVVGGLHSALAPAVVAARAIAPSLRIAYVMTDGAALILAYSRTVAALKAAGLLDATITAGQATGGDLEAISVYGALVAAKAVARADIVIVSMGPGNLGSGTRLGFASIEVASIVNAVAALEGKPIVVPRISFSDERPRHRGLSHHTVTALQLALAAAEIALPPLDDPRAHDIRTALKEAPQHMIVDVALGSAEEALRASPVPLRSMGRTFDDDPDFFRAAAAAGVLAARAATGKS